MFEGKAGGGGQGGVLGGGRGVRWRGGKGVYVTFCAPPFWASSDCLAQPR